ncbi:hypothetical protein ACMT9U_06545 [Clavibacter sp. Sh2036]|uniref:hypothetical protein n=1 Tax=unclassified Clavibacter TaxID=2626594 RepID=UPI0022EB3866|nr:hypothetical protein [Clavibacter sp. CT19]MDA3803988.1 hypothetical protein [Clavibacter sp. CT19]
MMAAVAGGGTRRADGLIDPDGIPGVDMAPELIRSAAWTLASASAGVSQHGATAVTKWQTMSTVYEAPESEALLAVMGPVGQETTALADGFTKVGKALTDFADTVAPIVAKLVELKAEAVAFVAQAEQGYDVPAIGPQPTTQLTDYGSVQSSPGGMYSAPAHHVEWTEYAPYSQRNDKLIMAVATLATALDEAQADCVNKIAAAHPPANSCPETVHGTDFTTAAKEGKPLPFGQTAAGRPNCVTSFGGGVGDAAKGMVEGLGSLVSYNPETGQWGDWDHAGKAALGVVEGLGSLIAPTPLFQVLADDSSGVTPGWMRDFSKSTLDKQQQMVDGFVGSKEQWQTDPARAAGSLFVNVGSLFIPGAGEVAAGAKVVSVGARMIEVGGKAAEAADVATVAGRLTKVGGNALLDSGLYVKQTGLALEAVSDRVAELAALPRTAAAGAVSSLREALERVPRVSVSVERTVTADGAWEIPNLHVSVEHPGSGRAASAAAGGRHAAEMAAGPSAEARAAGAAGADAARGGSSELSRMASRAGGASDAVQHGGARTGADALHDGLPAREGGHGTTTVDERAASADHPSGAHHDPAGADGAHHGDPGAHAASPDAVHGNHDAAFEHPRPEGAAAFDGPGADVANRHPIPSWITDRLANPEIAAWKKRILEGHEFNYANHHRYPQYEVVLEDKSRVDSYAVDEWIASRKHTQAARVRWFTMKRYIDEIEKKYAPGKIVKQSGDPLTGMKVLELPPQTAPIPQKVLDYASSVDVIIRDSNGRAYNIPDSMGGL